jgi:hypothetical protein
MAQKNLQLAALRHLAETPADNYNNVRYMSCGKKNWPWFAKTELLSACVRPSVRQSAFISAAHTGRLFVKFDTWGFLKILSRNPKFC